MCFSATANFVGSTVLGAVGVVTLTKVKHRRELLFASLPVLFAIHQFIEGFVWLGLDGKLSPQVSTTWRGFHAVRAGAPPFPIAAERPAGLSLTGRAAGACCRSSRLASERRFIYCGR